MLKAEIIAVGSEMLTPDKTDTNSLWLTEKLNEIGIEINAKSIIGDDAERLEKGVRAAIEESDLVITTGGLGPTEDDITRQITARAIGRELILDEAVLENIKTRFLQWGREMPETNKRQAYVIEGGEILPNPNGSAPGMYVAFTDKSGGNKSLVVLPGPPREMRPMFENFVLPKILEKAGRIKVRRRVLKVTSMGESAVDELISPIYKEYADVLTSILFNKSEIEVHLTARGASDEEIDRIHNEITGRIREKLDISLYSENNESLEEVVGRMLKESGKTLSLAESCTGGLIAQRITEIPGSSAYFIEGAVTYHNDAKMRTLNVSSDVLEKYGAVSAETAEAMARGMRKRAQTDFALSVTGIAGPDGGTEEKPVGLVFLGYADDREIRSYRMMMPGDRQLIRWRSSQAALDLLRRKMLKGAEK
jgi:nicotinamide-nucleotide amidase